MQLRFAKERLRLCHLCHSRTIETLKVGVGLAERRAELKTLWNLKDASISLTDPPTLH
jgi:hypothetical protein